MMGSIKNYMLSFLLLITLGLGYTTYHLDSKLTESKAEVIHWTDKAAAAAKVTDEVKLSCDATLKALMQSQATLVSFDKAMQGDLSELTSTPLTIPSETTQNASQAPTGTLEGSTDLKLSPSVMRLLDNAYCSGAKDDPYCTAR